MGLNDFTSKNNDQNGNGNGNNGNIGGFGNGFGFVFGPNGLPQRPGQPNDEDIMNMFINYNERFKNAPKVLFRDDIIEQLLSILIGKNKPNGLLIGPAGTGKTAIVETIAMMIANDDPMIPDQLKGYTIWELPLANVVAGAKFVGELEENVKMVVEKMEDPNEKAILFIDEIHTLISSSQTYDKIAQILKPALARGNMHVIGATTLQEANNLNDDPAFNRRFSRVIVDELSKQQTIEILKNTKTGFIQHYQNIVINDTLLETVATLADQYRPVGSHRPDNALTLLDRTIGEAVVNRKIQVSTLQARVNKDPNDTNAVQMLNTLTAMPTIPITDKQIRKTAISLATGNSKRDTVDMNHVKQSFAHVKGQDEATREVIKMIARQECNLMPTKCPTAMMFIGPSGVGKTEIATIIAKELTGQEPITLNMTEYSEPATINRIIGSPAGYVGSDSHTELIFDKLESNPYAVILLDEFEKACSSVQRLFYQILEKGTLTDNHGKTLDFSKTIIIATTNAGYQELKRSMGFASGNEPVRANINDLSKYFDPALLNRISKRICFNPITKDIYREILHDTYIREAARIASEQPQYTLAPQLTDDVLDELVEQSYEEAFGARPAFGTVKTYIEDLLLPIP